MTQSNTANRLAAAASAFALSFLLIANTVVTPAPAKAATSYVGVVA